MSGGGDGGSGEAIRRQDEQEALKAASRAAINKRFGVYTPMTSTAPAPAFVDGGDESPEAAASINRQLSEGQAAQALSLDQQNAATRTEAERAKAERDAEYQRIRDSVLAFNQQKLSADKEPAQRNLKFALLRSGNSGGSVDIDQNNLLRRKEDEGVLQAQNAADAAALNARTSDEQARLNLLSRVDAGLDQGSAIAGTNAQLQNSAANAIAQAKGQTIGNVFDNAGLLYQAQQQGQGNADAVAQFQRLFQKNTGGVGQPQGGYSGSIVR